MTRPVALVAVLQISACAGVRSVRLAEPEVLPTGAPQTSCERSEWIELVPTQSFSTATQQVGGGYDYAIYETSSREMAGHAIFRYGSLDPEPLDTMLPKLGEDRLFLLHEARVAPIKRSQLISRFLFWPGMTVTAAGLAVMIADMDGLSDGFWISTGVACTGLVAMLASLVVDPPAREKTFANIRATTLAPDEDDIAAARRGVDRYNENIRARCGGPS